MCRGKKHNLREEIIIISFLNSHNYLLIGCVCLLVGPYTASEILESDKIPFISTIPKRALHRYVMKRSVMWSHFEAVDPLEPLVHVLFGRCWVLLFSLRNLHPLASLWICWGVPGSCQIEFGTTDLEMRILFQVWHSHYCAPPAPPPSSSWKKWCWYWTQTKVTGSKQAQHLSQKDRELHTYEDDKQGLASHPRPDCEGQKMMWDEQKDSRIWVRIIGSRSPVTSVVQFLREAKKTCSLEYLCTLIWYKSEGARPLKGKNVSVMDKWTRFLKFSLTSL